MSILKIKNLKWFLLISIIVHLIASTYSIGFHQYDEHYQILEFANYKLGNSPASDLPWEFNAKVRPTIQPTIAYFVIKAAKFVGVTNPFTQAIILRILSSILSITTILFLIAAFKDKIDSQKLLKWFLYLSFFLWFASYTQIRFSSETWSGSLFFLGFALFFYYKNKSLSNSIIFIVGLLFGLSFIFRYQSGLLIAGFILWLLFIDKSKFKNIFILCGGILLILAIGVLVDKWFYGVWTFTAWNYLDFNIIQGKAASFGLEPWYYYLREILEKGVPPFSIFIILLPLFWFIVKPKNYLTWTLIPFILVHFLIGHKELRFLFPLINILPLIFILAIQELQSVKYKSIGKKIQDAKWKWVITLFLIINTFYLIIICFRPADYYTPLYQFLYDDYNNTKTELIYYSQDPFLRAPEPANFYMSKNINRKSVMNADSLNYVLNDDNYDKYLLLTNKFLLEEKYKKEPIVYKKVYMNLPRWIENFNFHHWLERTSIFTVYEMSKIKE